jgi:hypothetical protein
VGKDVVVKPALVPAQSGASYRLNWGDGSAVETVSEVGTHHYAKAQVYKVSASAVVGSSELNHEILLDVKPSVWPPVLTGLLAVLAGLTFWGTRPGAMRIITVSSRLGAPGVSQMTLLSREPYTSWSFEPGARPAEGRISFFKNFKKRRKSGSEQG